MNLQLVTIKDIKDFLNTQNIKWSGKIWKGKGYSQATTEDFTTNNRINLLIENDNNLIVEISTFSFKIYTEEPNNNGSSILAGKTLSKDWQQFMLNRNRHEYGKLLFEYCNQMCLKIMRNASAEAEKLEIKKQKTKTQADIAMEPYIQMQKLLYQKYLDEADFQELFEK